jgi:hypothetical protein
MAGIAVTQGRLGTIIRDQYEPGEQEGTLVAALTDLASGNPNIEWLPDTAQSRPYKPRLYGEPTVNAGLEAYARKGARLPRAFEVNLAHGAVDAIERLLNAYLWLGTR